MQHYTFYFSGNCSIYFGWYPHPSSGAQTTVSTASGICHTVTPICCYRGRVGTGLSLPCEVPPETCRAVSRKINCVTLHLVGCILQYYYDARTHVRQVTDNNMRKNTVQIKITIMCFSKMSYVTENCWQIRNTLIWLGLGTSGGLLWSR
jgi:hypothetical protein